MKRLLILFCIGLCSTSMLFAQGTGKLNLGLGIGLDYGGFGGRLSYSPVKQLAIFGAAGYNLNGLGHAVGLQYHFPSEKLVNVFVSAMYGYNAVLIIEEPEESKTTYYGPTLGTGLAWRFKQEGKSFLSFELLLPFRPQAYEDGVNALEQIGYEVKDPWPVTISLGYHFILK